MAGEAKHRVRGVSRTWEATTRRHFFFFSFPVLFPPPPTIPSPLPRRRPPYLAIVVVSIFFPLISFFFYPHQIPDAPALKVSFMMLLGGDDAARDCACVYTHCVVCAQTIRITYRRSLPGDPVYSRNFIPIWPSSECTPV